MPVADPSFVWQEAALAFASISVIAFLVTWVVTDLGRVPRTPYIAILTLTTLVGVLRLRSQRGPFETLPTSAA